MPTREEVGARLKACRQRTGLSGEKAAADLGISASALAKYESGERTPRDEVKIKLADYYKQTVQAIFFDIA